MKKIFAFVRLSILIGIIFTIIISLASQYAIPDMGLLHKAKRGTEKAILLIKVNSESKAQYYEQLLETRLAEFNEILDNGNVKQKIMYQVSLRYATTIGEYLQYLQSHNMDTHISKLDAKLTQHKQTFQQLLIQYPSASIENETKWIQDAINYIDRYQKEISQSSHTQSMDLSR